MKHIYAEQEISGRYEGGLNHTDMFTFHGHSCRYKLILHLEIDPLNIPLSIYSYAALC
jgi:hypothetical protein